MAPLKLIAVRCCHLQVDGQSHVVHSEEEALGTRLTIDSLTCLMANETDPSKLLAISPGKLMRYLVPDESHVVVDQPYAEIEVRAAGALRHFLLEHTRGFASTSAQRAAAYSGSLSI